MNNASGLSRYWDPGALSRALCYRKGKKKIIRATARPPEVPFLRGFIIDVMLETKCTVTEY